MRFVSAVFASISAQALLVPLSYANDTIGHEDYSEIIVTAQRRSENIMSVPLSIQAASGDSLQNLGINDLNSVQFMTPGYLPEGKAGNTQIFIRGIGNAITGVADPSVAIFIDDVPIIYSQSSDNLVDIERIEILKGAQGGLYGRNATGGVVNIITKRPDMGGFAGKITTSYGEYQTFRFSSHLNLPLSEAAALSVSVDRISGNGYIKNITRPKPYLASNFPSGWDGRGLTPQQTADFFNDGLEVTQPRLNDQDYWSVRGKLLLEPSENFSLLIAADYSNKDDSNGLAVINLTPERTQAAIIGYFNRMGIQAVFPDGFLQTQGKFETARSARTLSQARDYGVSATATWNLPNWDVTSITAYRNQRSFVATTSSAADVMDIRSTVNMPNKNYVYQELRAISDWDGPWRLLGGATYLRNSLSGAETRTYMLSEKLPMGVVETDQEVKNWSAYLEAGYDISPDVFLTVSGRYMEETNSVNFTLAPASSIRSKQSKFIPSITLNHKLNGGSLYARWARGFKTGGTNIVVAPSLFPRPEDGSVFGPETVDTYEIGIKQAVMNRAMQVTAAIFYNDYRGLQINARGNSDYPQISTAYVNAKSARTYGAEASAQWKLSSPLSVGASVAYLNAKFKDFALLDSDVIAPFDLSGKTMPKSPQWQFSFNANLDQPVSEDVRVVGSALLSHISKVTFIHSASPGALPDSVGPAYWLANARIGLKSMDNKYSLSLVGDNIFNKAYFTSGNTTSSNVSLNWGKPRVIKIEAGVEF